MRKEDFGAEKRRPGSSVHADAIERLLQKLKSNSPQEDTPMFNPTADISGGRVQQDDYYGTLLGKVYGDIPIRSSWDKDIVPGYSYLSYGRESGVMPSTPGYNDLGYAVGDATDAYGNFSGNVFGDRTGDYTQTGNSLGPIPNKIEALKRFLKRYEAANQ